MTHQGHQQKGVCLGEPHIIRKRLLDTQETGLQGLGLSLVPRALALAPGAHQAWPLMAGPSALPCSCIQLSSPEPASLPVHANLA